MPILFKVAESATGKRQEAIGINFMIEAREVL